MNRTLLFWRTVDRELRNARRAQPIVRVGELLGRVAGLVLAGWGGWTLHRRILGWMSQRPDELTENLALILASLWLSLGAWAGVGVLRLGLARDEQQLLWSLPLRPRERWRALLVRVVREWVGLTPITLTLAALGAGLLALGPYGLPWLLAAGLGMGASLLVGPLLVVGGAVLLLRVPLPPGGRGEIGGLCLEALALRQSGRDRAPAARLLPGLALLGAMLARQRTPEAAILWRGLISQSRNWTFRLRVLMTPALCAAGLWLYGWAAPPEVGDGQLVAAFAIALALLTIADGAASPVGSEGERLALLLTTPAPPAALLRGKFAALLLAVGAQALFATVTLGVLLQLGTGALLLAVAQMVVALPALAALFVGGSVFDSDLTRSVEDSMQALLVEEAPVTRVRLILVGFGALLAAAQVWLIVALDGGQVLVALAALSALVVAGAGVCGRLALPLVIR